MAQQNFEEPPELLDSSGEKIVVFRRSDGTLFSNHPEYELAKQIHEQGQQSDGQDEETVEEDVQETPDNNDGVKSYEEMTSAELVTLAHERGIKVTSGARRSAVIKAHEDWDAEQAAAKAEA
jgi:hypothetical protein